MKIRRVRAILTAPEGIALVVVINFSAALVEVFPGTPELRAGYLWPNARPGLGIDIDEQLAARYPISLQPIEWTQSRWPDGTLWTP